MPNTETIKDSPTGMDIISGIEYLKSHRPMLRNKFNLALQNYVLDHHHIYITTDDAEVIITFTDNRHLNGWFDEKDNIRTEDFPWLIDCFMEGIELSRQYERERQQHT